MPLRVGVAEFVLVLLICLVPLAIAAVVAVVLVLLNRRRAPEAAQGAGSPALEVLKERYARGELTREQYEEMRRTLEQ